MIRYLFYISLLALSPLAMAACGNSRGSGQETTAYIARVGSQYLTRAEAKEAIPDYVFSFDSTRALKRYRSQWINRQLALRKARDLNLTAHETVQKQISKARQEVLLRALKRLIISQHKKEISLPDSQVIAYYRKHRKKLVLDERFIKFRQVKTKTLAQARKARNKLQNGVPWPKIAHKYSLEPDAMVKMSTKYWPVSSVFNQLPIMKQYAARLDSGQISPIKRSHGVYRFIQLTDVLSKGDQGHLKWFINQLKEWRMLEKQQNFYKTYLKKLYFQAKHSNEIEIFNLTPKSKNP